MGIVHCGVRVKPLKDIVGISIRALLLLLATILTLEIVLQLAFPYLPQVLTKYMPQYLERMGHRLVTEHGAREYPAGQLVSYDVTPLSGDMYQLTCISPADAPPFEPYRVSFKRDKHGFRNAEPWPEEVDVVVLGDSFTAAELVQQPFWQNLSESMLVLAVPGSGTLEQQRLFDAFALPRKPETVVLAFFAGNDLRDNESFAEMISQGLTSHDRLHRGKNPLDYSLVFRLLQYISEATTADPVISCHYPVIAHTDSPTPVAFYRKFLPILGADRDSLLESEGLQLIKQSISEMASALASYGAELLLLYIPQRAELYWSYLDEASKAMIVEVESRDSHLTDLDKIDDNLSVQRDVMKQLAADLDVSFLDLTTPLADAIRAGQSPYFFADTHWNQQGHNIARNALLDFLNRSNLEK